MAWAYLELQATTYPFTLGRQADVTVERDLRGIARRNEGSPPGDGQAVHPTVAGHTEAEQGGDPERSGRWRFAEDKRDSSLLVDLLQEESRMRSKDLPNFGQA